MAKYRLESSWGKINPETPIYLLDLIAHRDVSDEIASKFGITHQSPQLILLKEGKAIYDSSHISISSKAVAKHI